MDRPCPPHWTFAARAAYFGELMCPFCDHRNPVGAKFCNDCAWPLHLKPCAQCNAINNQVATNCYNCGAACPVFPGTSGATPPGVSSSDVESSRATAGGITVATPVTQPPVATGALRNGRRFPGTARYLFAAVATILIAGAYATRHINTMTPDAMEVALEPIGVRGQDASGATLAVLSSMEPKVVEPETTAALPPAIADDNADAPNSTSARQSPVTVPALQRAAAQQRPAHERRTSAGAPPRSTRNAGNTPVGVRVAQIRTTRRPDRWQAMEASLARCSGDLFERIVCDQRVRLHYCDGHWGKTPHCATGVVNEHGQ